MHITYESLLNEKPDNEILYHYTDQNGLCGIIVSKKVWATNIYYLNDSEEFKAAADLAVMLIDTEV